MGGGGNPDSFFNPKNLIPAIATGGLSYVATETKKNLTPTLPKFPDAPPVVPPTPNATQNTAVDNADRMRRFARLRYGFASTLTSARGPQTNSNGSTGLGAGPTLKTTLGS